MFVRLSWFRLALAMSVVIFHLWRDAAPQAGRVAVLMFFFISGYLVTRLLNETYRDRPRDFLINRFLRIYPIYWACLAISLGLIVATGGSVADYHKALQLTRDPAVLLANLGIFGLDGQEIRWLPAAWSLSVELVWYLVLFVLHAVGGRERVWVFRIFLALPMIFGVLDVGFYAPWTTVGYAFVLGALRYDHPGRFAPHWEKLALVLLPCVVFVFPLAFGLKGDDPSKTDAWLNLLIGPWLLYVCFPWFLEATGRARAGALAGSLSYPLFLIHWPLGALFVTQFGVPENSAPLFLCGTLSALVVSYLVVLGVERPLERIRARVRGRRIGLAAPA